MDCQAYYQDWHWGYVETPFDWEGYVGYRYDFWHSLYCHWGWVGLWDWQTQHQSEQGLQTSSAPLVILKEKGEIHMEDLKDWLG